MKYIIKWHKDFFLDLYNKGYIYEKVIDQLYCDECKRSLPDRYVEGTCPYCESEGAREDQCEVSWSSRKSYRSS